MGAAALETREHEEMPVGSALLRQQVAERLAAHRSRRVKVSIANDSRLSAAELSEGPSRSQRIASAVAERYAQSQSYRAFLAAEAEEATRKAHAAADVAARTARAVAAAQRELMEELAHAAASALPVSAPVPVEVELAGLAAEELAPQPTMEVCRAGISVKLYEDTGLLSRNAAKEQNGEWAAGKGIEDTEETRALDEEIWFRQSPTFELTRPSVAIPGNLLEFPRQLVAARKARPRYAEGPLLEEAEQHGTQMRIFEVEAEQMTAAAPVDSAAPEWSSIWLDALAGTDDQAVQQAETALAVQVEAASMERRVMAALVDGCLVGAGFVGFAAVFAYRAAVLPSMGTALAGGAASLAAVFLLYQMLFFSLADATPGMRYARIGLCTFDDENPTRAAMRRRAVAVLIAGCPLGLGFLWACVDDQRLGWHDRMSKTYQRSY